MTSNGCLPRDIVWFRVEKHKVYKDDCIIFLYVLCVNMYVWDNARLCI